MPQRPCEDCTNPATHGMVLCALCIQRRAHAEEAALRAASEQTYRDALQHKARIGCASFIPRNDAERRQHRQARRQVNFGSGLA